MKSGELITIEKNVYEVRDVISPDRQCRDCAAFEKKTLCKKLPMCDGIYFRRLTNYEMRQAKKKGKI